MSERTWDKGPAAIVVCPFCDGEWECNASFLRHACPARDNETVDIKRTPRDRIRALELRLELAEAEVLALERENLPGAPSLSTPTHDWKPIWKEGYQRYVCKRCEWSLPGQSFSPCGVCQTCNGHLGGTRHAERCGGRIFQVGDTLYGCDPTTEPDAFRGIYRKT